jgi:hypothetical protein
MLSAMSRDFLCRGKVITFGCGYGLRFSIPYRTGASLYVNRAGLIAQAPPESTAIRSFETGS